jgi:hypothetical protein
MLAFNAPYSEVSHYVQSNLAYTDDNKKSIADKATMLAVKWRDTQSVGWNASTTRKSLRDACNSFITANWQDSSDNLATMLDPLVTFVITKVVKLIVDWLISHLSQRTS